jgi:hypothetical protein
MIYRTFIAIIVVFVALWPTINNAQVMAAGKLDVPTWILSGASVDCDFVNQRYWNCAIDQNFSIARASTGYAQDDSGIWRLFPNNTLRIGGGNGLLIEEARTNLALWSRDMTQSGTWVAVTMTAALNAVGIDGTANSATTLTSTSTSGTILQSLTQASAAYTYTVYVKGITVTGAIKVADYPVLTPAFTTLSASNCFNYAGVGTAPASGQAAFLRCTVTATSLNPVIGFNFANSGDSIAVDGNQLEAASFGTSLIVTAGAAGTRAADNVQLAGLASSTFAAAAGSLVVPTQNGQNVANLATVLSRNGITDAILASNTQMNGKVAGANHSATLGSGTVSASLVKTGWSWDGTGTSIVANNGTLLAQTVSAFGATTNQFLGTSNGSSNALDGYFSRLTLFSTRLPDATLKALTQ